MQVNISRKSMKRFRSTLVNEVEKYYTRISPPKHPAELVRYYVQNQKPPNLNETKSMVKERLQ
jgi:hypothetical protein